jgi:hypothetical protein
MVDKYFEFFALLNEGANGVVNKEDFLRWVAKAGETKANAATPICLFKGLK